MQEIANEKTELYNIWIGKDDRGGEYNYLVDAYAKVRGGVKHLVQRYNFNPPIFQAYADTLESGFLSRRPYKLAQACDGSIDTPVHALFNTFCQAKRLDPVTLYRQAYPDEGEAPDYAEVMDFANWQGVKIPARWGQKQFAGLIESLTEVNNHSLVGVLLDMAGSLGYTSPY